MQVSDKQVVAPRGQLEAHDIKLGEMLVCQWLGQHSAAPQWAAEMISVGRRTLVPFNKGKESCNRAGDLSAGWRAALLERTMGLGGPEAQHESSVPLPGTCDSIWSTLPSFRFPSTKNHCKQVF